MQLFSFWHRPIPALLLMAACWLGLCGCFRDDTVTPPAKAPVDTALLGNWTATNGIIRMTITQYEDANYVVVYDNDLYHTWAFDLGGGKRFVIARSLAPAKPGKTKKFFYSIWQRAADGTLHGRGVNAKLVGEAVKDLATLQKVFQDNVNNPDFLADDVVYEKDM